MPHDTDNHEPIRPKTDYELQQMDVLNQRIEKWDEAYNGFDFNDLAEQTASILALWVHIVETVGAEDVMSRVFKRLKHYDKRTERMQSGG